MATHPVHGMLEQETRAGASSGSIKTESLVLQTTSSPSGDVTTVTVQDTFGKKHAVLGFGSMVAPGMSFRELDIGYAYTDDILCPNGISFSCDSNYYDASPAAPVSVMGISSGPAGEVAVYGVALSIYEPENITTSPTLTGMSYWNAAKDTFQIEVAFRSGGAQKDLAFCSNGGIARWKIAHSSGAHFLAATDGAVNIGASGANRPGKIFLAPSTTARSHLNLAAGVAPTTPVDGDIWFEATGLKIRIGGATKTVTVA